MTKQTRKTKLILIVPLLALAAVSCVLSGPRFEIGELKTESHQIEYSGQNLIFADIDMGVGELNITGGANELLEAEFKYNVEELQPEINFNDVSLDVHTPQVDLGFDSLFDIDDFQNEWNLTFSDAIPIDLKIDIGAGDAQLELGSLQVNELQLDAGAGDVDVDFSGSSTISEFSIDAGVGQITLDLRGEWSQGLHADIQAGVGQIKIWLPEEVGVRVDVEGGLTDIDTSGLDRSGRSYYNDAYGESDVEIRISINAGVGAIDLIVGE